MVRTRTNHIKRNKLTRPLVSIVMPVHNGGLFLRTALDSILKQTYRNFELIIVNDASDDNTVKTLKNYKKLNPQKIRIITLEKSLGKSGDPATNLGISRAKGFFIAKMDSDDISHPDRIKKQVHFLLSHPQVFLVGTQAHVIDKKGTIIGEKKVPTFHGDIYRNFFLYNYIVHPSIMFRREGKSRFYDIKYDNFNEYYTFFKLMSQGKVFANLPDFLMQYRIHGKNDTLTNTRTKFKSTLAIRRAFITEFRYLPTAHQVGITALQTLAVFMLPQSTFSNLYLLSRNVITFDEFLIDIKSTVFAPFRKVAYAILKL